jgi:hypothetical protein
MLCFSAPDITTDEALVAYYGNSWPSQGVLRFSGTLGTSVRLSFLAYSLSIDADTDGNGTDDWHEGLPKNVRSFFSFFKENLPVQEVDKNRTLEIEFQPGDFDYECAT